MACLPCHPVSSALEQQQQQTSRRIQGFENKSPVPAVVRNSRVSRRMSLGARTSLGLLLSRRLRRLDPIPEHSQASYYSSSKEKQTAAIKQDKMRLLNSQQLEWSAQYTTRTDNLSVLEITMLFAAIVLSCVFAASSFHGQVP
jgi:hypothetical protein